MEIKIKAKMKTLYLASSLASAQIDPYSHQPVLQPDELFSCRDSFHRIEWNLRENITPIKYIAAGNKDQIYAISALKSDKIEGGNKVLLFN